MALLLSDTAEQKHVVKATPMQTLKDVLQAASSKFRPALVAEQCDLQLNKKAVDLNTPFRLLNIPAGSKLRWHVVDMPRLAGGGRQLQGYDACVS